MANTAGSSRSDDWIVDSSRYRKIPGLKLTDGSKVAVMGGGPAGSLFAYFALGMAEMAGLTIELDLFDPHDFVKPRPAACNMCGGIISETLVQNLATDGINLPSSVVQRGVESYILHMDGQQVRIATPVQEKRIASVFRGTAPRKLGPELKTWKSFDGHLQELAIGRGARPIRERVTGIDWHDDLPHLETKRGPKGYYDLVAVATGVNSPALKLFQDLPLEYESPTTTKTFIREFHLGEAMIEKHLGNSMHVFLLDISGLEFAAVIPKLNCATVCLLGDDIGKETFQEFLQSREVRRCLPLDLLMDEFQCNCSPRMNIAGTKRPYADRVVFIGDSGVTRLYKDGIGAAYRTAKAAARTAVFSGISAVDFERHYLPACKSIRADNRVGHVVFGVTDLIQKFAIGRRAILRMVSDEQEKSGRELRMSTVMWDMFTGSASYGEIFLRTLHPAFLGRFAAAVASSLFKRSRPPEVAGTLTESPAAGGQLGEG